MVPSWRYSVDNHSTHRNQNDLVRLHWLCTKANIVYKSLLCYFCSTSPLTLLHFPLLLYRSCHSEDWKGLRQLTSSLGTQSVTTIWKADRVTDFFGYIIGIIGRVWGFFFNPQNIILTQHITYSPSFFSLSKPKLSPTVLFLTCQHVDQMCKCFYIQGQFQKKGRQWREEYLTLLHRRPVGCFTTVKKGS